MKIAVIYSTMTNHSKKIAEAIGSSLNVKAQNITENPVLNDVDLLFIVSGIYGGVSKPELLEYIKKFENPVPKYAAIVTSCASGKQKQTTVQSLLEEKGIKVLDEFVCRGRFLFFASIKHPNENDLKDAVGFAQKIVNSIGD